MKKILRLFVLMALVIALFSTSSNVSVKAFTPLDQIEYYEIKVDPLEDGTLNMYFKITWRVLDDKEEGPLSWVKIGIPNYHVDKITTITNNISDIDYSSDDGAFIRIDFKNKYYQGDIVTFEFSTHQAYMYTFDETTCYYQYKPGWFDEIKVDQAVVLWNKTNVVESNTSIVDGDYLRWEFSLGYGETFIVSTKYNLDTFTNLDLSKQYTDDYLSPEEVTLIVVFFILFFVALIGIIFITSRSGDPYMRHRGFCCYSSGYYYFPIFYSNHYYYSTKKVDRKGTRIINPIASTSHGGISGGSCACACACACAGGGRAGCSRKDFYNHTLKNNNLEQLIKNND